MFVSRNRHAVRRIYSQLDYARHFPKAYVDRLNRVVPKKVYDNRYGAPPIVHWTLPPDDYVPDTVRPWENKRLSKTVEREKKYFHKKLTSKFFQKRINLIRKIPDEEWTFFPGDMVQIMVGKDKGLKGLVSHVIREANAVFVDGLHTKLNRMSGMEEVGLDTTYNWEMEPLYVDKEQVKLVDPNDDEPCTAKWLLNIAKTDYVRVSERTGYEIPLPAQAFVTYEYMTPKDYIEVEGKDTPAKVVLQNTYEPKLSTFESEIEKEYNLKPTGEYKPTYWY